MQIWITFILINLMHQTHVSTAPVDATFGKIADAIINPAWTFNNPDSPTEDNKDTDLNKKNDENLPNTLDGEIDYPNTKNKKKNNSRKKNKRNGKKYNNNKRRRRNNTTRNGRRNNTRRNGRSRGRYLWYSVFTMDDLLVNLPEYRNHEDEQKIVFIWDDKQRIVQNEHVDALSMNNLNNNQLIRQKRDCNNILELQDNILQTRNINQHDLKKNKNSTSSNSNENTNENMKFLNLRNSNTNKFRNILQNRKQPTNTNRNKVSRPNPAQGLGIALGADNSEKEGSQLKIIEENPQKVNAITTLSNDKPELIIKDNTGIDKNTPEIEKIDTLINGMNSNSDEGADDDQDSESYPSSIETKNKIPNYSDIEDNKQHVIIKHIKHQFKPKSRKLEKKQPKNNDKGTLQTRFTPNSPSINQQKTPSIDIPEHKTDGNTDNAKNIPMNDEIDTLINTMNSNSEEDSSSDNSDSNTSSLEKQQDILDFSDLGDNKEKNLFKSIKQPLKPISNMQEKKLLVNNEKQPEIYEKYLNNPSEINTKKEKDTQQKGNTPTSQSINNQQTPSINVPGHITPEHTDVTKNIPVNDEIETIMNAINSNSEEGQDNQNSESNPSSLETKQEIPNYSDVEDNKQHDILKNIKHPFKPKSRKLEKKQPKNNDKGTLQTRFTPNSPSINQQKTPSIDIPEHKTEGNTDIAKNIPTNDEIETLINTMNSNSEEDLSSDNSDSNTSSLEKQQDILDFSDLGDNKGKNLFKSIKQPLKPISNMQEKKLLVNNEKQPEIYEKYLNNPSEINTKKEKGTQQKCNTPTSQSINNQQTPSINVPGHITPEHTDVTKNIPVNDEIETIMNAINSNSEEGQDNQNSESNPSSIETKQEIPNYSDVEDNKQHDILKNIKHPFKPKSRKLEKKQPKNNDKGTLQTRFTPNSPSINQQKTPSMDIPEHKTEGNTDIAKNIPTNDEIDTLINKMNSNSEEDSSSDNSDSNTSSLEKQQDILDFSDLGDNKEKNVLISIKQPLKPLSNMQGKKLLVNNKKLPGIYKQKIDNPLEINKNNEEEPQQKTLTEIPFQDIDVTGSLEGLNNLGGITMEDADVEKIEDQSHSSVLDYNNKKGHDDILKIINQPIFETPNTGKSNTEFVGNESKMKSYTPSMSKNIEKHPKRLSESRRKKKLDENSDSNSIADLLSSSISFDKVDLSEPGLKKKKVNPKSKTGHTLQNSEDTTLKSPPRDNDLKPNIIHKNKSIKTPDLVDTIDPVTTPEIEEISLAVPLDDFDVLDSLEYLNNIGGMPMKSAEVGKMKDKSPISVLNNKNKKDHKDSLRKTNQKPNKNIHKTSSPTKTEETPKPLSGSQGKKKLDDISDSNSMDDLLGDSLDFDEVDLSQLGLRKKTVIPISKTNDIIKIVEPDILKPNPTNNDDKSNTIQKNISINTPNLIDSTVPKSTEKVIEFSTESPLNVIDVSDSLGEFNNMGGFTIENAALEKIKDESRSTILNNNGIKDHDDSLQIINQPMLMNPNTGNPNTEYKSDVDANIEEIPKKLSDGEGKRKLVDKFGSNSYGDLFGGSLDFVEEDLSQPVLKKKKVIPMSKTNDILKKGEDDKLKPIPTKIDDKPNTTQKYKSIKTPNLIDTTVPKSTEKVIDFSTESPLNVIDVSDSLGEFNNLGGFTIDNAALEKIKDESRSTILNNNGIKDHDDSLQITNQPMLMYPNTVNSKTENKSDVDTNIEEIPKKLSDGEGKRKLVDKFGSNSNGDLFGGSLDFVEEDLSQPVLKKKKVIPMSKTNDILKKGEDDKLKPIPTKIDDKPNTTQKYKSIKTPNLIDTTVPKSTEKVIDFSTESPLNVIDVSDSLGEFNNLGGFTIDNAALEKIKDESRSTILNNNGIKDHDDSLQITNQPMLMYPNTVNSKTENKSDVDTNIEEIPKKLSDGEGKRKLVDKFGSNSNGDLFGGSLDFVEEDLSQSVLKKKKVIPMSKTNDILKKREDDKLKPIPTNIDDNPNTTQKYKSIKTPNLIDTTVPKSTEKVIDFSTESPLNVIDVSDSLGEYNNLGGFTIGNAALEKIKDESPSTILNNNGIKDHDDSLQITNQPMLMNPNTVNSKTENKSDVDTNIEEIPKKLSDGEGKRKLVDKFGSNSYGDLFGGSLDFVEEELSQPVLKKKKVIPMSKTNDILKKGEDDKLKPIPTKIDDKPNTTQKYKSIKTPNLIDTTVPKSTEKVIDFSTESPLNVIDVSDSLGEYNNLGGFTIGNAALEKIKDESPSTILNNNGIKDHDDSLQITNQPMLMNPNTVNSKTENKSDVDTNIEEIPKKLSDGEGKIMLVDKFGSNSYGDLFGGSLDFVEDDLSQPVLKKKKVIPMSKTNDILKKGEDDKLKPIPTKIDDKPNTTQKYKSIKTPNLIDTTVPKSTEKVIDFSTESPLNVIDVSDSLGEYNNIGGFTIGNAALEKIKDESRSTILNNNGIKDHADSLQITNQPMLMYPNTVNSKTENKSDVDTNIEEIPKKLSDGEGKRKLVDKFGSNSNGDLFGGSLDFVEEDLSQPVLKNKKVIPMSKTNDILKKGEDDKLKPIPTNIDDNPNTTQKYKSIKTPNLIDTTVPKSTEKVIDFSTESPLNVIDVSDSLGEFNNLGGFTIENAALEKIKDESRSTILNNNGIKDHDDSLQITNQPMLMNPNTVNSKTENKSDVDTNIEEIPKKLSDGEGKRKLVDKFGSNSYGDLFGGSLDFVEEELSQPVLKKKKVIPMSKTNDILKKGEDDKLKPIPTKIDDKPNTTQKYKSIKTPNLIDTTVPKSTEKVIDFSTESPLNVIDVSDSLGEYNNLGGFTIGNAALEKIKDESPSTILNNNGIKDHDDSLQITNQPMLMNPNTVNSKTENKSDVDTNIEEIPKKLSDGEGKIMLVDKFGSNSYGDLFGGSLDFVEEDLSQPVLKKKKVIPMSKTNDILKKGEDDKLKPIPTKIDDKPNTTQKYKSIKTPNLIDTTVPKSTEKVIDFSTESPLNVIDVSDSLGEYNNIGGFTIGNAALEKIKDESRSTILNNNGIKDHADSLQITNQPMLMYPNTVNSKTENKSDVDTNIEEIPKKLSDGEGKRKLVDKFGSNSNGDLFGGSLDFVEEDLSQPVLKNKKVIPMSKTNDILKKGEDDKLKPIPTNIDDNPNTTQKYKSIKTPNLIDTTVPKSTEKVIDFSTESPLNVIDVSDSLGEFNNLGGFTIENAALEKIKDESRSTILNNNGIKDHDDSLQITNQPMLMNPNTVNSKTENKSDVDTNIEEIPKKLSDGEGKRKLVDKFGSNSYGDLFGGSLDFVEEDLSQPVLKKKKVIPMSKTNDILKKGEDDKLKPIPTKIDDKPNTTQKYKSIKTPNLIDTTVPKSTEKVIDFSTESPLNVIDVSDSLGEFNNMGGFTIENAALEKIKDESRSTILNNNGIKDHDDSLQITNQPMLMNPNTVNSKTENKSDVDTNIEEIPKKLSDGEGKRMLVDKFGSNSYGDLFGGSLDFVEEDLSQPVLKKKKVIPMSKTNDILKKGEDDKLKPIPTKIDDNPNTTQKYKSIKTPNLIDTTVPKSTEKVIDFSTESPLNVIDVSDSLGEYNNLGGFTIGNAALEKIKDESPSTILNNNGIKDHDDSLQITNQPMLMNPNTVNSKTENKSDVDTNIEEIPKKLSDGEGKRKLVDKFGSNSYGDLFGGSLDFVEEDLSQPVLKKKKVIPMSKTNDILKKGEDDKLKPIPTKIDDKPNTTQKYKSIKTPNLIDTTVPKSTEKVIDFSTESPLNVIDVSDSLGEFNNMGGFTIDNAALKKIKDESPSTILNNNGIKDHDDSLQITNQPMLMNSNTVNSKTENKSDVDTNIEEIPKKLSDGEGKRKLVDKFGSNSYGDLFGGSLDFVEEDLSQPVLKKKKVIPMSKTNDILKKGEDDKLKPIPTKIDDKPNTTQKYKSIKTPNLIDTTVPKSTEKVIDFSTESPLNVIDVSDSLGEFNNMGGFTIENAALEKIKDESRSTILNNNGIKDHDDSLQITNQPMLMNPNTVNSKTENKSDVDTNIEEIPKKLSDGEGKRMLVDKFGSNSYGDLFGGSLDFVEEDLSQPVLKKKKVIPMSKTNDILKKGEDDKLKPIPTKIDDNPNTTQKYKSIKTPNLIDTTVPKSTEKVIDFSTESPLNVIDVSDSLGEYNNLGGFTIGNAALEKIKDESPSTILNNNGIKDHDDSLQITNQPMLMNPNTVNSKTENKSDVDTNIEEIPKKLSDGEGKRKLVDKFGSNSYGDLFGGSLDFVEEDLSQPVLKKKKVIPMSKTNDILKKGEDDKLKPIPTKIDDKPNTTQKYKSIKTPNLIDTTVPKSTEKVIDFSTESPLNVIDVSDSLGEFNNMGGFTIDNAALKKIKDESPSTILNNNGIKDHDDSLQITNQPMLMNSNTVNSKTENKSDVDTNIEEIPKKLSDGEGNRKLVDKFGSNSYGDLFGGSLDFVEEDLSQPVLKKKKVIPISKTNAIIKNVEDDKLKPIPSKKVDIKANIIHKKKLIKMPDFMDTTVPSTYHRVNEFSLEIPFKDIDVSHSLEGLNNLKDITMDDAAMERIESKSPSSALNNYRKKNSGDSLHKINEPKLFYPVTEESNTEYNVGDVTNIKTCTPSTTTNIEEIPNILPNSVSNTDSKIFDLIEPTTQTNYDIIKNDNKLPLSKIPFNVIDKHPSNSKTMHNYNNNLLNNDKDVTFNRSFITNRFFEYNSKDLSSLEDDGRYGYMFPKFSTKYNEDDESNYNLWETIPPKKSNDVSLDKGYDNLINDFNQSSGYTTKNNKISTPNENNIVTGTESVKNNYNNDKVNTDIHNKQYDDFIKKMSEQLFKKIDDIDDKLAKLEKVSHNCSYVQEIGNIGSHEPTMNNVLPTNDIPNTKPEKVINIEDTYSKTNEPIESLEININNKSDDENEINKNESLKAKKHKRHGRDSKKKGEKNNKSNNDDGDDGDDDDDDVDNDNDNDYDNHKNNKRQKHKNKHNDDNGKHKKNKRHKNKDINKDDDVKHKKDKRHKNKDINNYDGGKHKKNKRHKNKDLNDNDIGKLKKNKRHKKNKRIDDDNDNGGHRKKSHKKKYSKVDNDVVSKNKKHKSHKKKDRNYNDDEILRSKKTDNKKKKKLKEYVYSPEESNDVNYSSSIQINSENNDSVKRLKTTSSKSKISKKTNSTKSKKSSPKKKSKYVKHSKTIKYKNKEIPVDISDEDTSSNENNYNSGKTYIKYISNNNQNNVPKDKKHKHKKHNKHSKTSKTYMYKKIPEDKDSDENSVNSEETYNINIISDDDALRQKKHRHKKNKKKKNFDINIVKDTDTQVLNNDKKTQNGFQFYTFYPQYRYATLNPFARLLTNSYL